MARYKYRFEGKTLTSAPKEFVQRVRGRSPELAKRYADPNELKYINKRGQKFWFQLARRIKRELSSEGWDIEIVPINDIDHAGLGEQREEIGIWLMSSDRHEITGEERELVVKARVNQGAFRKEILKTYKSKCCITGMDIEELLVASHIKPWAESSGEEKLRVENGLLLNRLHDHAFDRGLIAISADGEILVGGEVSKSENDGVRKMLLGYKNVNLPEQVRSNQKFWDFIAWHKQCVFRD